MFLVNNFLRLKKIKITFIDCCFLGITFKLAGKGENMPWLTLGNPKGKLSEVLLVSLY